ncbi:MAG: cation diffusion facilitator family transporter [Nitrososphaera sp.]|uniref:cation diffusion facilitator family transporter n=1 Tax=Nitrososphaera sp. TaxID=1971748 RepID=UPI00183DFFF6|nr:cation diffusion facilitator family transporter [Nitrososphaera sp.]NWG37444.1 cation transporter [Nitrososphaera sp.]
MDKTKVFEEGRRAAWVSVWTLLGIGIGEIVISTTTGSLTLAADGFDSLADALVSFIVWLGIGMLHKPKSKKFPFGYTKIESFAAFVAAVVIIILGAFIVYHAYERFLNPVEVVNPEITMLTLVGAGAISLHRAFKVRKIAKKYDLISLNLDAKNSIKDGTASFVGLSTVLAGYFGIPHMDSVGSIMIAGYIFYMAYSAFKESTLVLVDAVENPKLQEQIITYVRKNFGVAVEQVRIRPLGHAFSAQVHVVLESKMTLDEVHALTKKIQESVEKEFETEETVVIPRPA